MTRGLDAAVATVAATALLALAGCEQTLRNMYDQPRYKPLAASPLWPDGRASREPVAGTLARSAGAFAGSTSGRRGAIEASSADPAVTLPPISAQLLARGRERFDIFCSPCHGSAGYGDGMVARRGFSPPPSFHTDGLRNASDAHLLAVIANGYGAMYSYATRVEPADRLAIVAYIRALQLSQHASSDRLDDEDRARLAAIERGAASGPGAPR